MDRNDIIRNKMVEDIKEGNFSDEELSLYFNYVTDKTEAIDTNDAYKMLIYVSTRINDLLEQHPDSSVPNTNPSDPFELYESFESDKYVVAYYTYIEEELIRYIQARSIMTL